MKKVLIQGELLTTIMGLIDESRKIESESPEAKAFAEAQQKFAEARNTLQAYAMTSGKQLWEGKILPLLGDLVDQNFLYELDATHHDIGYAVLVQAQQKLPISPPKTEEQIQTDIEAFAAENGIEAAAV